MLSAKIRSKLTHNPLYLLEITNFTEEECLFALSIDGGIIKYIRHHTPAMELVAVKENHDNLYMIHNPCQAAIDESHRNCSSDPRVWMTIYYKE